MRDRTKDQMRGSKLLVQFSFFFLLSVALIFASAWPTNAATQWVSDPGTCNMSDPTSFPGQNCDPVKICGDNAGIAQCYNTATLLPPAVSATSNTLYSASYPNGGYLTNCYATMDAAAPYCDNNQAFWCNRSNTCYTTQARDTICTANTWATATCGSCRTGYADCDLDGGVCEIQFGVTNYPTGANNNYLNCTTAQCDTGYLDCDAGGIGVGNGCEIQNGATCTVGGLTGTWSGCTCLVGKQYFETGTEAQYATIDPLLWGVQFGAGDLMHFGNSTDPDLFVVKNDGSVNLGQITAPGVTTDLLYNVGGSLYWNGAVVGSGGGAGGGWTDDGTVVRLTTSTDRVGIGTNNPKAKLDIGESMIGVPSGDTSILLTQDGGDTFLETSSWDMAEGLIMHASNGGPTYDYGVVRNIGSSGYALGWERGLHIFTGDGAGVNPDPIIFRIDGNEAMRIIDNGNVGIGTTTPDVRLQVVGNSTLTAEIANFSSDDTPNGFSFGYDMHGGEQGLYEMENGSLLVGTKIGSPNTIMVGQQAIYIDYLTKNVGIGNGNENPFAPLQIASNGWVNTYFQMNDISRGGVYIGNGSMFGSDEAGLYDAGSDYPLAVFDAENNFAHYGNINIDPDYGRVGINLYNVLPGAYLEVKDPSPLTGNEAIIRLNNGTGVVDLFAISANPNGVVTAPRGSLAMDYTNGTVYINKNSATLWSALAEGSGGGSQTLQDVANYTIANEGYILANFGSATFEDDGGATKWEANTGGYQMQIGMAGGTYLNFISDNGANNSGHAVFNDGRALGYQRGIEYNADYSAYFTARSLVDKGYVDSVAGGGNLQAVTDLGNVTNNNIEINNPSGAAVLNVISGNDDAYLNLIGNGGATVISMSSNGGTNFASFEISSNGSFNMRAGSANVLWADATTGNIGIGVTASTPLRRLHVEKLDAVTNAITYTQRLTHTSSGLVAAGFGTGIEFELENASNTNKISGTVESIWGNATNAVEDGEMVFKTMLNGTLTEAMRIDDNGNLGVGNPNPLFKLDVNAGSDGIINRFMNSDSGFVFGSDLYGGEAGLYDAGTQELIAGQLLGNPNLVMLGQYAMYINQTSKNVGIGTATPDRLFHVETSGALTNAINYAQRLTHTSSGLVAVGFGTGLEFELENASNINKISGTVESLWGNATNAVEDGEMVFKTMLNGTLTEAMRIDDNGNLGVGTSSSLSKVTIAGDNSLAPVSLLRFLSSNDSNIQSEIYFKPGDEKTYWDVNSAGGDSGLVFIAGSEEYMRFLGDEVVVNEGGLGSKRFRVEADTNANAFYVSAIGNGSVGIGTNSPDRAFHVETADAVTNTVTYAERLSHTSTGTVAVGFGTGLEFELENASNINKISGTVESIWGNAGNGVEDGEMVFKTMLNGTLKEAMRIDDNGNIGIGTGTPNASLHIRNVSNIGGHEKFLQLDDNDQLLQQLYHFSGDPMLYWDFGVGGVVGGGVIFAMDEEKIVNINTSGLTVNAGDFIGRTFKSNGSQGLAGIFNRIGNDGVIISLRQDDIEEGTISVSGNTVSYNAFTGSHYTWHDGTIEKGTLVSMTGKNKRLNDNEKSEVLYGVEVTKQINSPKVLGSYLAVLEPAQALSNTNPALVMAVGNGEVWVADKGENIEAGDYLISSDVLGHAQKMDSDFALNYVVARAAEDIDWSTVTETVDGAKHKMITVFFDSLVVNTQMVDVIKTNTLLGSRLNLKKMGVSESNKIKKQLGGEMGSVSSGASGMQVGQATIPAKRSSVDVTFAQSYDSPPIVMLTLASDSSLMRYFVSNVTSSGFRLNLYPTQYQDALFNWQAYPASGVQSGNTVTEPVLEDLPEYEVPVVRPSQETFLPIVPDKESNTLNLNGAEDVLYNSGLSIVEVGDGLGEEIANTEDSLVEVSETPVTPEIIETPITPETPEIPATPSTPEITETPAENLE